MKYNGKHESAQQSFPYTSLILLTVATFVLVLAFVAAKYVMNHNSPYQEVSAAKYHFTSDYLAVEDGDIPQYTIPVHEGTKGKIFFSLRNWDGMEEKYSPRGFDYTITITCDGNMVDNPSISGQDEFGTTADSHEIWINNLEAGTYDVTVEAQAPYELPALKGQFILESVAHESATFEVEDDGHVVHVTIYSNDDSGLFTITYPETVVPDPTDSRWRDNSYNTFTAVAHSKYKFTFFKKSGTDPVTSGFDLEITE